MYPSSSPQKRKHSEYQDPDYPDGPSSSKQLRNYHDHTSTAPSVTDDGDEEHGNGSQRLQRICDIISREFQNEITLKQQQLEQIDDRLAKARVLLDRLRYAIVAEYYRKQELPLSQVEVAAVRGSQTLFDNEHAGPQMALHPSLKKIIGKKPRSYEEILRSCPVRAAAQNAKHTIRSRSQIQRRQERRLQQLIREQGIVIDHSKQEGQTINETLEAAITAADSSARTNSSMSTVAGENRLKLPIAGKALNGTRLNNKTKHIVVVGNTSKYIGADGDLNSADQKPFAQILSHKWLVYVQAKDAVAPLEGFIKKVRFFLHPSYRPNDVVDICAPPFQIARRGWGEFPMRIQLFFHERLQQKPVQLVHNLVLDKTQSGLHTLGAETLVEIWLRPHLPTPDRTTDSAKPPTPKKQIIQNLAPVLLQNGTKLRTISFTQNKEELEDNLFAFLNKIEETPTSICADIEKIQPTVMVTEPLACKMKPAISKHLDAQPHTPSIENKREILTTMPTPKVAAADPTTNNTINSMPKQAILQAPSIQNAPAAKAGILHLKNHMPTFIRIPNSVVGKSGLRILPNHTSNYNNNMPIILSKVATEKANPNPIQVVAATSTAPKVSSTLQPTSMANFAPKKFLQKKLVQLVDAEGKVKYLQMLVATSSVQSTASVTSLSMPSKTTVVSTSTTNLVTNTTQSTKTTLSPVVIQSNSIAIKFAPATSIPTTSASNVPNETPKVSRVTLSAIPKNIAKATNAPKNVVFQKEGKLYIIDPMQIKLKQQRKKQESLLKPQVSLLKQQAQQRSSVTVQSVVCDHDYAPRPATITTGKSLVIVPPKAQSAQLTPPPVHLGMRQTRVKVSNALEQLQLRRTQFEQQFLKEKFATMRSAVEYLLRRLPLIDESKESCASAFSFVRNSQQEFQALPAFKQRACEWLRSKYIAQVIHNHEILQQKSAAASDTFWSTREIATFARYHAYTPAIKTLLQSESSHSEQHFTALVKSELKNEQQLQYETLTTQARVGTWVDVMCKKLQQYEDAASDNQTIDVDGLQNDEVPNKLVRPSRHRTSLAQCSTSAQMAYLPPPEHLEPDSQLVVDICKDLGIRLQSEEILEGVWHPTAQTLLAQSLHIFVEKLLRESVATKLQQQSINALAQTRVGLTIAAQDIGKVIAQSAEFDFLTNCNFGTAKHDNESNSK